MDTTSSDFPGFETLAYAYSKPGATAQLKQQFDDFQVSEEIGFEFTDSGNHACLQIRKTDLSTIDVVSLISRTYQIKPSTIGFAGMKDRRAVTTQWFSVPKPVRSSMDFSTLESDNVKVIDVRENDRKIKKGSHKANKFKIRLHHFDGDQAQVAQRMQQILHGGAPNYFGPQRFGRQMNNLHNAVQFFADNNAGARKPANRRLKKSLLLSATRSFIFNQLLSRRVVDGTWNQILDGEIVNLAGTNRFFSTSELEQPLDRMTDKQTINELQDRLSALDIHPSGLLYGKCSGQDRYRSTGAVELLERQVSEQFPILCQGLEKAGLRASRRSLRLVPREVNLCFPNPETVEVAFTLSSGVYATSLLRELCQVSQSSSDLNSERGSRSAT